MVSIVGPLRLLAYINYPTKQPQSRDNNMLRNQIKFDMQCPHSVTEAARTIATESFQLRDTIMKYVDSLSYYTEITPNYRVMNPSRLTKMLEIYKPHCLWLFIA